ncbi:MAG: pirin family protein [Acidobacteria bacterium]|nr:pirin family protein [Acidobacteriota bacterium]
MISTKTIKERQVSRIDTSQVRELGGDHQLRPLVLPGNWAETDPFLLLAEDWYGAGAFDDHPHRGFETVTYVVDGTLSHHDNQGNHGMIRPGEALWLTAGRGIVHNEDAVDRVHTLQLWINLPRVAKNVRANYQELRAVMVPVRKLPGAEVKVFSGRSGDVVMPTSRFAQVTMLEIQLDPDASFSEVLPPGYNCFIVMIAGNGWIGTTPAQEEQVAWLNREIEESQVRLKGGSKGLRAILYAGLPLNEPVAAKGPFVMTTDAEIAEAYSEFQKQGERFGL